MIIIFFNNKTRRELVETINKKDEQIEEINMKLAYAERIIKQSEDDKEEIKKIIEDLKKQKKVQSELINQLRNGRAELLRLLREVEAISENIEMKLIRK